jgi:hypothetical protein
MVLYEIREKDGVEFCSREQHVADDTPFKVCGVYLRTYTLALVSECVCVRVCTSFHLPVRTSPEGKNRDPTPSFSPSLQLPE